MTLRKGRAGFRVRFLWAMKGLPSAEKMLCRGKSGNGSQMREEAIEGLGKNCVNSTPSCELSQEGMKWLDLFVNKMMNARVSEELKRASLKEHLQNLLTDNQILKREVAIQREHNIEQGEKIKGVQQLKNVLNQYQEKLRSLEGSESLASWQANLLFEPIKFEGLDVPLHRGIYEAAKGIYQQMLPEVHALLKSRGSRATFRFIGHSVGCPLFHIY